MLSRLSRRAVAGSLGALALASSALAAACGRDDDGGRQVVATTTMVADLARNVAGNRADVVGLLAANSDPHDYEPRPSDAEAVGDADVVLESGGDLDLWADQVIESAGGAPEVVSLIDSVATIGGPDETDPHWWQDPRNAIAAVERIARALSDADPAGADAYQRNARRYVARLEALDHEIAECVGSIPIDERELVTGHDSLGYFADRYDLEVVGAAIPALTTLAQASAGQTAELVGQASDDGVRAVFPEAGLNPELEEAIAEQTGAEVGGELWGDTLGPEGSPAGTYLGAMAANAETIAAGLGGRRRPCEIRVPS